ncbi:MAG: glycosyltransferase [Hyphomicrobiaceae bacterium]
MVLRLSLDVVVPTYNRVQLLERTLASLAKAERPDGLHVGIIVVDNNSSDGTRALVERWQRRLSGLRYLFEPKQGRSHALNAGIIESRADLIGMIDDDEEVDDRWFIEIAHAFADETLDFLGGPCLPNWGGIEAPAWLPRSHGGLIGWIVPSEHDFEYGPDNHAYMVGGNAVVRRRLYDTAGLYHTGLGRTGAGANGGEDLEFFGRLMAAGARGRYRAGLIIHHHIPMARLDRRFFRKRSFWDGVSIGFVSRTQPEPVPHIFGIPRYFIRSAVEGMLRRISMKSHSISDRFADELRLLELFGRVWGRYGYTGR